MNETLARITINPETKKIRNLSLHQKLRFKCRRCAIFCCKLGGPWLTEKDIKRIKQAGYNAKDFLEPVSDNEFKGLPTMRGSMKNREDGSCIFLKFDAKKNHYECLIYDFRPALCRLYPFDFERVSSDTITLKLIPCCRGLNNHDGESVDEEFITIHLVDALLEAIGLF
ncbi:MAG: YkgJ family cysteine cluster protein [Candidatus Bathyarchaeaceae archaeon]